MYTAITTVAIAVILLSILGILIVLYLFKVRNDKLKATKEEKYGTPETISPSPSPQKIDDEQMHTKPSQEQMLKDNYTPSEMPTPNKDNYTPN